MILTNLNQVARLKSVYISSCRVVDYLIQIEHRRDYLQEVIFTISMSQTNILLSVQWPAPAEYQATGYRGLYVFCSINQCKKSQRKQHL